LKNSQPLGSLQNLWEFFPASKNISQRLGILQRVQDFFPDSLAETKWFSQEGIRKICGLKAGVLNRSGAFLCDLCVIDDFGRDFVVKGSF
jgi:hypothetical protein